MQQGRGDRTPTRGPEAVHSARVRTVTVEVAARLRQVCASFPEAEFLALARGIAEITVKYADVLLTHPIKFASWTERERGAPNPATPRD